MIKVIHRRRAHTPEPNEILGQPTAVVRPCISGKAELMGDTCAPVTFPPPLPVSPSTPTEVDRLEDMAEGFGVAGVFAVGTFPMNHEGTQPRSPVSSLTA